MISNKRTSLFPALRIALLLVTFAAWAADPPPPRSVVYLAQDRESIDEYRENAPDRPHDG